MTTRQQHNFDGSIYNFFFAVDENVGRVEGICYKEVHEVICKNDDPEQDCLPTCKHLFGGGNRATCAPQFDGPSICACVYQCWINIY